jgi:ubiquinone/menaquinone biosynthesis C-methylase UbiE
MLQLYRGYRLGMQGIITGHYTTRVLQALFHVGYLDEIEARGRADVESFARANDLDPTVLRALCDALYSLRILKKDGDAYALDARGRDLVGLPRGWFEGIYGYEDVFYALEDLLTKKKAYGRDVVRRLDVVTKGYAETGQWIYYPRLLDMLSRGGFKRVLDLGCGDGAFLRVLCQSANDVTGYGVDLAPEVIATGRQKVDAAGLGRRVSLIVADASKLDSVPELSAGIDVATAFFLLHELLALGPERVVQLLRGFREAFPGVPLIVIEVVRPPAAELRRRPGMAILYFLYHDLSRQKPVSRDEWRAVFTEAGFHSVEENHLWFLRTIIFTLR